MGNKLESIFKYIYLIHIILACNVFYVESSIMRLSSLMVVLLGSIILLKRLVNWKKYKDNLNFWLYVLFVLSYCVSCLFTFKYGFYTNAKILMWMCFQIFILYMFDSKSDCVSDKKCLNVLFNILVLLTTLMSFIGIAMLFAQYTSFKTLRDGSSLLIGVAFWGRLYGVFTDANYGAVLCVCSIVATLFLAIRCKNLIIKIFYFLSIAINFAHIAFSASRTGLVTLCVSVGIFTIAYIYTINKKILRSLCGGLLAVLICYFGIKGSTYLYNNFNIVNNTQITVSEKTSSGHKDTLKSKKISSSKKSENKASSSSENNKASISASSIDKVKIGRQSELNGDISNRRFDLWKNAVQVFESSPVVGISFGNYIPYVTDKLPDCYMINNDGDVFAAFHNMFFDLLASQGIIGILIFLTIVLRTICFIFKNFLKLNFEDQATCICLFSICIAIAASSMFVSDILYINNQCTVLFWLFLGYLIRFCRNIVTE